MYYGGYYYAFDPTYILVIIGVALSMIASMRVKSTFGKYSRVMSCTGLTGAIIADRMLRANGITDVEIRQIPGDLTDNYNPREKTLNLSQSVYNSGSVAAIGVAAHECGHAIQHNVGYAPIRFRSSLVPVANIGSSASWIFILLGVFLSWQPLITLGISFFTIAVLFHIVTLPVEFDASNRAIKELKTMGIMPQDEISGAGKVLKAAALTYVASAAVAILQLLRLLILFGGRDRD